jgi:hypothetical protein
MFQKTRCAAVALACVALAACSKDQSGTTTVTGATAEDRPMPMHGGRMADGCPCQGAGDGGATTMQGGRMGAMAAADTRVEDVEGGVRITFVARDAKDVQALRDHARTMAEHMKEGGCPMM